MRNMLDKRLVKQTAGEFLLEADRAAARMMADERPRPVDWEDSKRAKKEKAEAEAAAAAAAEGLFAFLRMENYPGIRTQIFGSLIEIPMNLLGKPMNFSTNFPGRPVS